MKNLLLLISFTLVISCSQEMIDKIGCGTPNRENQEMAESLLGELTTFKFNMKAEKIKKLFGCYYEKGDEVYSYARFMSKGYILVRDGKAISYSEAP